MDHSAILPLFRSIESLLKHCICEHFERKKFREFNYSLFVLFSGSYISIKEIFFCRGLQ